MSADDRRRADDGQKSDEGHDEHAPLHDNLLFRAQRSMFRAMRQPFAAGRAG
jgi:hypothetical protein